MKRFAGFLLVAAAVAGSLTTAVRADKMTDWKGIMLQAAHHAVSPTSPLAATGSLASAEFPSCGTSVHGSP